MRMWTMRYFMRTLFLGVILWLSLGGMSSGDNMIVVTCVPRVVSQGGVSLVGLSGPPSLASAHGEFEGSKFPMGRGDRVGVFQGLLGIDLKTAPGNYVVRTVAENAQHESMEGMFQLEVGKGDFGVERLTLPPSKVDLDSKTLERVRKEAERVRAVLGAYRDKRLWNGPFMRPVQGAVTSPFGVRRILNGQERSPHTGVDLRAVEGTPIRACNSGVVVLADDLFFSGMMVVLDHGWGLYSMYSHLSKTIVCEGDSVAKGDVIGLAGSTGRVTGPHLDWRIRLNGARVDPLLVLDLTAHLGE
jgi:murein DD-endopeptidase MepM/ murein hydrolase activator NlpD